MTNPTERPEERDWLAEIEARLEKAVPFRKPADDDPADVLFLWTLVASDPERPFHTCEESENYGDCEHPEALAESELIAHAQADLRTLINEVKDAHKALDEANDTMFADLGRITQMEEALRGLVDSITSGDRVERVEALDHARAALSPSDTEERHEAREESDDDRICPRCGMVTDDPSDPTRRQVNS